MEPRFAAANQHIRRQRGQGVTMNTRQHRSEVKALRCSGKSSSRLRAALASWTIVLLCLLTAAAVLGQRRRGWGGGGWGGGGDSYYPEYETCKTAREVPSHSTGTPNWTNEP